LIDSEIIRIAIEKAVSDCVDGIRLPGIASAAVRKVAVSSEQLQRVVAQLEQHGKCEITLPAEVELVLRVSNIDALRSIERTEFRVTVNADAGNLLAVASSDTNWEFAWQRGIEPIKEAALQAMKSTVWNLDASLVEDSYTFKAAIVLLVSEMVGPYTDRVATFLGYPVGFVQVIAARLIESGIWDKDEVSSEPWLDPKKGMVSFMLDLMVAEGKLTGRWSEEKGQRNYYLPRIRGRFTLRSLIDGDCQGLIPGVHKATSMSPNAQTREVAAAEDAGVRFTAYFFGGAAESRFSNPYCRSIDPLILFVVVFLA
jgi:hypothetical protein